MTGHLTSRSSESRGISEYLMDVKHESDAALVVAVAKGQEPALAEVYARHSAPVIALARRLLRSQALAEEVAQEVFVRLWSTPEKYDADRGSLRAYLLTQTHGRSLDMLRSETSRRHREEREAVRAPTHVVSTEDQVWQSRLGEDVRRALASLAESESKAIELAYFGGHTYKEVARLLGEPEGTIKSRIRAGMKKLRVALDEMGLADA